MTSLHRQTPSESSPILSRCDVVDTNLPSFSILISWMSVTYLQALFLESHGSTRLYVEKKQKFLTHPSSKASFLKEPILTSMFRRVSRTTLAKTVPNWKTYIKTIFIRRWSTHVQGFFLSRSARSYDYKNS